MYVADSLFFLQHLYTSEEDEDHGNIFGMKLRDIFTMYEEGRDQPQQNVEEIKNRMIEKSKKLSGEQE